MQRNRIVIIYVKVTDVVYFNCQITSFSEQLSSLKTRLVLVQSINPNKLVSHSAQERTCLIMMSYN